MMFDPKYVHIAGDTFPSEVETERRKFIVVTQILPPEHPTGVDNVVKVRIDGYGVPDQEKVQQLIPHPVLTKWSGSPNSPNYEFSFEVYDKSAEWVKRQLTTNWFMRKVYEIQYFFGIE